MTKEKNSFLHKRSVITSFGIVALIFGFGFMNTGFSKGINPISGKVTGNYIAEGTIFNATSLIGMLLIVCAAILIIYAIVKKE